MVYYGYIVQICESIQSDVPGFYYTERDVERWLIRHYLWWNRKCYLWVSIKTPTWLQFSLSHHTLQHTNSITNPLLAQINETLRQTVASYSNKYLPGGGGGGGKEKSDIFTHSRLRPFLGVQNLLISFFWGGFSCMYIYKWQYPPPHKHTYTNTGHTCTSKCTRVWCSSHLRNIGSSFSLFFVCLFHRGAHMLRSLTSFFFF